MTDITIPGILLLLALLQVKHAICDGPLQTLRMVKEKGFYGRRGGLEHAAIHGAGSFIVLVLFGIAIVPAILLAAAETIVHYHIDFTKESIVRHRGWTQDDPQFWWALMADQMFHHFTYLAMAYAIAVM
jgi:hypothetical protein